MMNRNQLLEDALSSIRQEHKSTGASVAIKERLVALVELDARTSQPVRHHWRLAASLGATLAILCGIGAFYLHSGRSGLKEHPEVAVVAAPRVAATPDASPSRLRPVSSPHRGTGTKSLPRASANGGGFLVLPSSEGLPAPSMTTLVRMRIRRDDLWQYGLDVSPTGGSEMVVAEFVVGQDGLSRAVRFVR